MGNEEKPSIQKKNFFEDAVIVAAMIIGLIGGAFLHLVLNSPPIITAVFLSIGISSLIFRFLGGIGSDNSFKVKSIKLTGTAAVLIACSLIINNQLLVQGEKSDQGKREKIVVTVQKGNFLLRNIEVTAGDNEEIIPPFKKEDGSIVEGKFVIPLQKLIENNFIHIRQHSDQEPDKIISIEYRDDIPKIGVHLSEE